MKDGLIRMRVTGDSMRPLMRLADHVMIERVSYDQIKTGDIICVAREQDFVCHRLVHKSGERWIVKGDAFAYCDLPVDRKNVLGRVIAVERGKRLIPLKKPLIWLLNLIMVIINIVFYTLRSIIHKVSPKSDRI